MESEACVHQLFEEQVIASPHAIAVRTNSREISYSQLNAAANHYAHLLRHEGVGPESIVGLIADRCPEAVSALLAILKAGGSYLPLSPREPRPRARFILSESEIRVALVIGERPEWLDTVHAIEVASIDAHAVDRGNVKSEVQLANLATVLYTSGSTGTPKGVMLTHRSLVSRLSERTFKPGETPCQRAPLTVVAHISDLLYPLVAGATVLIIGDDVVKNPTAFAETLSQNRVTFLSVVPSYLRLLLDNSIAVALLAQTRLFIVSGEALPTGMIKSFRDRFPEASLLNSYGMTETTGAVAAADVTLAQDGSEACLQPLVPLFVLDAALRPVQVGEVGEICVGGHQLARGYVKRPSLTEERFVANPLGGPGERLYRTGDLAILMPDGSIRVGSRNDAQLKIRGFLVDPAEVEKNLELHPEVKQAAVVGNDTDSREVQLLAYVVAHDPNKPPSLQGLQRHLASLVPDPLLPASIHVVESLPLGPAGKVDRQALRERAYEATLFDPKGGRPDEVSTILGTDEVRSAVWEIWRQFFPDSSEDSDFFDLGGDSLTAIRILLRIRTRYRIEVTLHDLFNNSTAANLAGFIASRLAATDIHQETAGSGAGSFHAG
jgi:amino acid adenylation domain-containing protein